jgi:hypothetical protein
MTQSGHCSTIRECGSGMRKSFLSELQTQSAINLKRSRFQVEGLCRDKENEWLASCRTFGLR